MAGVDAEVVFDGLENDVGATAAELAGCLCRVSMEAGLDF